MRATEELQKAFEEIASGNRRLERVILKALGDEKKSKPKNDDADEEPAPSKKRGRKSKDVDEEPASKKRGRKKAAARKKKKGPTKEDAQDAMRRLCEWYEPDVGDELLAEFDAKSVSDLDAADYSAFVEKAEELVEEAQDEDGDDDDD